MKKPIFTTIFNFALNEEIISLISEDYFNILQDNNNKVTDNKEVIFKNVHLDIIISMDMKNLLN